MVSKIVLSLLIFSVIYLIFLFIFKSKSTKVLLSSVLLIYGFVYSTIFYKNIDDTGILSKILMGLIFIVTIFSSIKIIRNSYIDFGNYQIASFSYLINTLYKNKSDEEVKKLGIVIPFSNNTVKFGGRNITYPEVNSRGGTMITGASGSGKSVQMMELIRQDISKGNNIVFFDFKGEKSTSDKVKGFAKRYNYEVYSLEDENAFSFDPLYDMSATGRVEAILNTRKWSMDGADAHFRTNTQLLIQKYINAFDKVFFKTDSKLYTHNLYKFIQANKPDLSNRAIADAYKTVLTLLEVILTSKLGPSLRGEHKREFSFKNAYRYNEKFVMIISIPSDSKEFANSISSFYFRNIMAQGTENSFDPPLALYIDEFGSMENPFVIKDIMEKGRSCGIMTTIAMQDIFQVVINTNDAYLNSLLGTVNNFLIFAGATREAASKMAGVQIKEVEGVLQTLMKPLKGNPPTACLITKIPILDQTKSSEVYKYIPYMEGSSNKVGSILSKGYDCRDKGNMSNSNNSSNSFNESESNKSKSKREGNNDRAKNNEQSNNPYDNDFTFGRESSSDVDSSYTDFDDFVNKNLAQERKEKAKEKKKKDDDFEDFLDQMGMF